MDANIASKSAENKGKTIYVSLVKRLLDIFLSAIGIVVFAVPMVVIAVVIRVSSRGPVLLRQRRFGQNGTFFYLFKFRSLKCEAPADVPTHQLKNPEQYYFRGSRLLREFSLDELPQLFNIFLGHMSVVGPRPALWNQEDLIAERETYGANSVKPGLTGWAQINGRDELAIPEKARLDGEYVARASFLFDCKCVFLTVGKVLKREGVVDGEQKETKEQV